METLPASGSPDLDDDLISRYIDDIFPFIDVLSLAGGLTMNGGTVLIVQLEGINMETKKRNRNGFS